MLQDWQKHRQYQEQLRCSMTDFYQSEPKLVFYYEDQLNKLYDLNLDDIGDLLADTYSSTGAPAIRQAQLFRSFLLMSMCQDSGITAWVEKLSVTPILQAMVGYLPGDHIHQAGSYYDLINRCWCANRDIEREFEKNPHSPQHKPKKQYAKNEKQPVRRQGIVQKLADLAAQGRTFESRPERLMQQILAKVGTEPAARLGLLGDQQKLSVSGDGTGVLSGGSATGSKNCTCKKQGIYNCNCPRHFADPYARFGWDSHNACYFYGHTIYILSVYNPVLKCDLPVFLRMVQASRHDSVSSIVSLAEFRTLHPDFNISTFCGDSAHDSMPFYRLLDHWDIDPVIALNKRGKKGDSSSADYSINKHGVPVCLEGLPMVDNGFCKGRSRRKFRCPLACGKIDACTHKSDCPSQSHYGRTVYVSPGQDLRHITRIPRGSAMWKKIMRARTASERVNKRLLADYKLEQHRARGKKRIFWWSIIHSINILQDAAQKAKSGTFIDLLTQDCAA